MMAEAGVEMEIDSFNRCSIEAVLNKELGVSNRYRSIDKGSKGYKRCLS
jgi:hypothetical protein